MAKRVFAKINHYSSYDGKKSYAVSVFVVDDRGQISEIYHERTDSYERAKMIADFWEGKLNFGGNKND